MINPQRQKQLGDLDGARESEANARQILALCEGQEDNWGTKQH